MALTHWRLTRIPGAGVPLILMLHPRDHHDLEDLPDDRAAELGVLTRHLSRHVQALPGVTRSHVYRFGDGASHLHLWFVAKPQGQSQVRGSWLMMWDDVLPEYPQDVAAADAEIVVDALVESYGGNRP